MLGFHQCGEAGLSSSTRSELPKLVHMASQYWYKAWWPFCLCWRILFWCPPSLLFKVYENVYLIPGSSIVTQKIRLIEIRLWNNNQHCIEWIIITHCIMSDVWSISIFLFSIFTPLQDCHGPPAWPRWSWPARPWSSQVTSPGTSWPAAASTPRPRWRSSTSSGKYWQRSTFILTNDQYQCNRPSMILLANQEASFWLLIHLRYHGPGDSPFLQWVPGAGGPPQTVNRRAEEGNLFRNRIKVICLI